jgi:deoxyhypusine synthase
LITPENLYERTAYTNPKLRDLRVDIIYDMAESSLGGQSPPAGAANAVLKPSDPVSKDAVPVSGFDFANYAPNRDVSAADLVEQMTTMGFQASSLGQAVKIVNGMVSHVDEPLCRQRSSVAIWRSYLA